MNPKPPAWLLLIHQIPTKPDYLRVKIGRRLQQVGSVAIKSTVYALPRRPDCRESFEWIVREIKAEGGEAVLCEATLVAGLADAAVEALFDRARNADYEAIAAEAREMVDAAGSDMRPTIAALGRLGRKLDSIRRMDFFDAPSRIVAEEALGRLESHACGTGRDGPSTVAEFHGRVWATRRGVEEDRIASAWLIRRFIDPEAVFRFAGEDDEPRAGELRFDTYDGDFTHQGDRCTFEVLAAHFAPDDEALSALGEIVHEIDLGDDKFSRPETPGVERLIQGIVRIESEDTRRLDRGALLFEALYRSFGGRRGGVSDEE